MSDRQVIRPTSEQAPVPSFKTIAVADRNPGLSETTRAHQLLVDEGIKNIVVPVSSE